MSRKIKATYDADPTAGDDLSKEGLFAGDDGSDVPVVYTRTQVSNTVAEVGAVKEIADRVGALETGTVPDPTSAFWNVTILDNTLTANVLVSMYTGEAYIIVKDDDTTPTDDSSGSTPPTGFTSGSAPSTYDMVAWASGELYFYQWIEGIGITEKLRQDGGRGIVVTPIDTTVPTPGPISYPGGEVDATTTKIITMLPLPTYGGLGEDRIDLYAEDLDGSNDRLIASDVTLPYTILGLTPNVTYQVYFACIGANGLSANSDPSRFTTDASAVGNDTVIRINKDSAYEGTEGGAAITVTFNLGMIVNGAFVSQNSDGDTTFDITTVDDTAVSPTNYTAVSTTLTISNGTSSTTQAITTVDVDQGDNRTLQVHIVPDSEANAGTDNVSIAGYPNNAVLVKILGTGGGDERIGRATYGGDELFVWLADSGLGTLSDPVTDPDNKWELHNKDPAGWVNATSHTSGTVLGCRLGTRIQIFDDAVTEDSRATYPFYVDTGEDGTYYLSVYAACDDTWENEVIFLIDGLDVMIPGATIHELIKDDTAASGSTGNTGFWTWNKAIASVTLAEGAHTLDVIKAANWTNMIKFVLADSAVYDPEIVADGASDGDGEARGPALSGTAVTGEAIDNTGNLTDPTVPESGDAATVTIVSPVHNATRATHYQKLTASIANASNISVSAFTVVNQSTSAVIPGTTTITGNTITWAPTIALHDLDATPAEHRVTAITGTCTVAGAPLDISYTGPWYFTPLDLSSANSDIVFRDELHTVPESTIILPTVCQTLWGKTPTAATWGLGRVVAVDPPVGTLARGNVMRIEHPQYVYGNTCLYTCDSRFGKVQISINLPTGIGAGNGYTELHTAVDVLIPSDTLDDLNKHPGGLGGKWACGMTANTTTAANPSNEPTDGLTYARNQVTWTGLVDHSIYPEIPPNSTYDWVPAGRIAPGNYLYDVNKAGVVYHFDETGTPYVRPPSAGSDPYIMPFDEWVSIELVSIMNTSGVADGITRVYVNGEIMMEQTNMRWRNTADLLWNRVYWEFMWGGNSAPFASPNTCYTYHSNIRMSESAITYEP